jgi:Tol biopolymer transport system component
MSPGLYISRVDGSDRRLVAQLDYWGIGNPVWSPDGKWLAVSVVDTDRFVSPSVSALINLESCQVFPLTGIEGTVMDWAP